MENWHMRKTKPQISFAVTAKLISVFVFATRIVQSLYFVNPKFQVPSYLQWLSSPVCVGAGLSPRRPVFWRRGSNIYSPFMKTPAFLCMWKEKHWSLASWKHVRVMNTPLHSTFIGKKWGLPWFTFFFLFLL